eukprot:667905-Amphidinium_carterae.2
MDNDRREAWALQLSQKDRVCHERLCELVPTQQARRLSYPQHDARLHQQAFYLTVIHATTSSLQELTDYLKNKQKRHTGCFLRRNIDNQYQINRDRIAKSTTHNIDIGQYMEIQMTFKQTKVKVTNQR